MNTWFFLVQQKPEETIILSSYSSGVLLSSSSQEKIYTPYTLQSLKGMPPRVFSLWCMFTFSCGIYAFFFLFHFSFFTFLAIRVCAPLFHVKENQSQLNTAQHVSLQFTPSYFPDLESFFTFRPRESLDQLALRGKFLRYV